MNKVIAIVVLGLVSLFGLTMPAQAFSPQVYCNSAYSDEDIKVGSTTISPNHCRSLSDKAIVHLGGKSYKVSYNESPSYSSCRSNNNFDAYDNARTMRFLVFDYSSCRHYD